MGSDHSGGSRGVSVPFFSVSTTLETELPELDRLLDSIVDRGVFVNGPLVESLEKALAACTGSLVVAVGSGTEALILSLEAAGIGPGDTVIVPAYSFIASASAVALVGADLLFVDIDPHTYLLDLDVVERVVESRQCRAVVPVHLFSQMVDMPRLCDIAAAAGMTVVEDSAEAIGMTIGGRHAGRFGVAGVLSFFPTKTLGALGDAGCVLTDDAMLAEDIRRRRNHGQLPGVRPYIWGDLGHNARMDEIQAAVLLVRLKNLRAEIARRRDIARRYDEKLADLQEWVKTPRVNEGLGGSIYYVYLVEAELRDELVVHLARHSIETETYYPRPLHLQPCFAHLGYRDGDFPVSERASTRALALPLYAEMTDEQVDEVCAALRSFYMNSSSRRNRVLNRRS